jgi:phosphate transport system substrate-binding protein
MKQQQTKRDFSLESLSAIALIALGSIWAVGLVGKGLWRTPQKTSTQSTQFQQPDTTIEAKSFAQVQDLPSGLFNYGGSTAWAPIRLVVDPAIQASRPELQLRYVEPTSEPPGSAIGIQMLIDGRLTFAQTSQPLTDTHFRQAEQRGFLLEQIPVAIDGIAVAVNPKLNIVSLTLSQLQAIYTGEITNWTEVGGPNLEMVPYSRPANVGGDVDFFVREVLQNRKFGTQVRFSPTTTEALRQLANTPGGIYFASAPLIVSQCEVKPVALGDQQDEFIFPYRQPLVPSSSCPGQRNSLNLEAIRTGQYPLTYYLYVTIKQNGRIEEQAGQAYANLLLTERGQQLITEAGFVRVR